MWPVYLADMDHAASPAPRKTSRRRDLSTTHQLPISQAIRYFTQALPNPGNYPRIARQYLEFCLERDYGVDEISLAHWAAGKSGNRISPVKKFLKFARLYGLQRVVPDPPEPALAPAVNELVLGFLHEATHLRGDHSKETYQRALHEFFRYLDECQSQGHVASLSALTVGQWVDALRRRQRSPFTINLYLSAVKQLAAWVVRRREHLSIQLTPPQLEAVRDIAGVRGLPLERGFYKDGLSEEDRDRLLAHVQDPRDKAMITLMVLCGLRNVELTRLRGEDVRLEQGQVWVLGKGKATRKPVKLFAAAAEALRVYLSQSEIPDRKAPLFPDLTTAQVRRRVNHYLQELGLKSDRVSTHSLRHTAGQVLIAKGVAPVHVQRQLRHEQFETTQFYIRQQTEKEYFNQMPDEV